VTRRAGVSFATIRTEGGLLPSDFLARLAHADREIDGLRPEDYHLAGGERLTEAISRSWARLVPAWKAFRIASRNLPTEDKGTSLTRERWLLILFQELGYGRLQIARGLEADGSSYPISHTWQSVPFHLVGFGIDIDKRTPGAAGAARSSPHGLVQDFLNRREDLFWGFVSNGLVLRILRDNSSLTRQAFVEFDLESMMEGDVYADFALLWLLAHQSRVETAHPEPCWLERWAQKAHEQGTRVLEDLRGGVEEAIRALGRGFLAHPSNSSLRELLRSGGLPTQDLYREILRLVYRLLFLFTAEDRELLFAPAAPTDARDRYQRYYSMQRLRRLAQRVRGSRHSDLWRALALVMEKLGTDEGYPPLALPALGSFLWSGEAVSNLVNCDLGNESMLEAARALAFTARDHRLRPIDYKNLGAEELGSVYESLLELHPKINADHGTFELGTAAGHERKTTGSYYTPESLVQCLLDSALDPVLDEAAKSKDAGKAILALKVCDPACGSGHFLIAAAHRIARRLAQVRTGDMEPAPGAQRWALRDVIGHCIYGVDLNPMAVELCKTNLWIEALDPGKPLSFLDHHIRVGNSLLGATPELVAAGLPDDAFTANEGDDKKACVVLRKRNKAERAGLGALFARQDAEIQARLQHTAAAVDDLPDDRPEHVRAKELAFSRHEQTEEYCRKKQLADAWCAAFVFSKSFRESGRESSAHGITQGHLNDLASGGHLPTDLAAEAERLSRQYQFFHWHMAFPEVLTHGGFNCVLGNPPWGASVPDRVKQLIRARISSVRRGTLDTFAAFTEHSTAITRQHGYVGLVLPDIILLKNYPDLRLHLLLRTSLQQIAHWGQAFPDASIDICTLVARIGKPSSDHSIDCIPEVQGGSLATSSRHDIRQEVFVANKDYRFNLQLSPQLQSLVTTIRALGPRVGDLFTIREGVHSGNVRDRLFLSHIDGALCRPLIFGRDEIAPMLLAWAGKFIQLDPSRFDRAAGDYYNLGDPGLYARIKILVRRTGDFVLAAPDLEGRFCSNNFFILVPNNAEMPVYRLMYAAAALNSAIATLYFRTIQPRTGKLFAELKITHLEDIPIPFFGDTFADEEGRRFLSASEPPASLLAAFRTRLFARIGEVAPQVAAALEPAHV